MDKVFAIRNSFIERVVRKQRSIQTACAAGIQDYNEAFQNE